MSEPRLAQGKVGKTAQQQHLPTHVEDPHGPRLGHTAARTHDSYALKPRTSFKSHVSSPGISGLISVEDDI